MSNDMDISSHNSVVLDENPTISEASMLFETLKCMLATEQDVTLDASRVKSIDTASMQLLTAFSRKIDEKGNDLIWAEQSEGFRKTAELLGLREELY